jgi:hypothetical protein
MFKKGIASTIFLFFCFAIFAQTTLQPKQIDFDWKGVVYKKELAFDVRLHTNGFAFAVNFGELKTYYKTNYYHLEFGWIKDPRERKQNKNSRITIFNNSTSFIYGKQNSFMVLRAGLGTKRYLSEKAKRKGVAIGISYEVGPSIGLLKPYYLVLERTGDDPTSIFNSVEKYSEENADVFLNYNKIVGSGGFFTGYAEISLVHGLKGKFGVHFSLGAFDRIVKALEAGIMFEAYTKKIPIMIETQTTKNSPYFVNLYVNLQFGKRN